MEAATLSLADLETFDGDAPERGRERRYLCPLCGDSKPRDRSHRSLAANIDTGAWHCHRCQLNGKLKEFWTERPTDRTSAPFRGRSKPVARRPKLPTLAPLPEAPPASEQKWRSALSELAPLAGTPGADYLTGRGVVVELAHAAKVRYCPRWPHWEDTPDGWRLVGHSRRVVFPVYGPDGRALMGVQARSISPADDYGVSKLSRGDIKCGAFATPGAWDAPCLALAEAPLDALALAWCGLPALATLSCHLPEWMPRVCNGRTVLIATDADAAGDTAAATWKNILEAFGAVTKRLRPEGAKDWNELLQADPAALRRQVLPYLPAAEFDPQCEELFLATVETVAGILCGAAAELPADVLNAQIVARCASGAPDEWPELTPLEVEMNEALAAGDLSRLRSACDVYREAALCSNRPR